MYLLKVLIWRAFKVRLRSHYVSLLDVAGPILMILIYLGLKYSIGQSNNPEAEDFNDSVRLFRHQTQQQLSSNPANKPISHFVCPKILYHGPLISNLDSACGLQTTQVASRQELVRLLQESLDKRVQYQEAKRDLRRTNSSSACISLGAPRSTSVGNSTSSSSNNNVIYQIGIVKNTNEVNSFDLYSTDSIGSVVLYQPYNQGSSYNEYKFPQSDLNTGLFLVHSCLLGLSAAQPGPLRIRLAPYPIITDFILLPILFIVLFLVATLCNAIATIVRVVDERETGFHQYARSCGVSGYAYWLAEFLVTLIHQAPQTLLMAMLLSIPTADHLMDPIYSSPVTIRWLFLLTTTMATCVNAIFFGMFFCKTSHALLTLILAVVPSAVYFSFSHQYNAYGFYYLHPMTDLILWLPATIFELMVVVGTAIQLETGGEPVSWAQLSRGAFGGGQSERTLGALWFQMVVTLLTNMFLICVLDEIRYSANMSPLGLMNSVGRNLCSLCLGPARARDERSITQTRDDLVIKASKTTDPNRICCSIRELYISGPTGFVAETEGDPLKGAAERLLAPIGKRKKNSGGALFYRMASNEPTRRSVAELRSNQMIDSPADWSSQNFHHHSSGSNLQQTFGSATLDDAIRQHLNWSKARIFFDNLNLDFRYNQLNYVIGSTNIKELFFASLMGLHPISSGSIIIEGQQYNRNNIGQARAYFGHLSERDVFISELTILENLDLFSSIRNPHSQHDGSESQFLLSLLHLTKRKHSYPCILTHRSARKLALGVAAVGGSKMLLLVEPTLNLRWKPRAQVLNLLKKYKSIRSIVVDTSDIDEASAFADRIVYFRRGAADLDASPAQISKQLQCGFRVLFEPIGSKISPKSRDLEKLTSDLFREDKLGPVVGAGPGARSHRPDHPAASVLPHHEKPGSGSSHGSKGTMLLKFAYSTGSLTGLGKLCNIFGHSETGHAGYRLREVNFESLEDALVRRMSSKASYPELPADMLVALSSRQQASLMMELEDSPASFRRLVADFQTPYSRTSVYHLTSSQIIRDRFVHLGELLTCLLAILASMAVLALILSAQQKTLDPYYSRIHSNYDSDVAKSLDPITKVPMLNSSILDQFYHNRVGFFLMDGIPSNRSGRRRRETLDEAGELNSTGASSGLSSGWNLKRRVPNWSGSEKISGYLMDRNDSSMSDEHFMANVIQFNMDIPVSVIFYSSKSDEASIVFEPYSPNALVYSMKMFAEFLLESRSNDNNGLPGSTGPTNQTTAPPKPSIGPGNNNQTTSKATPPTAMTPLLQPRPLTITPPTTTNQPVTIPTIKPIGKRRRRKRELMEGQKINISKRSFAQPWTEMIRGLLIRRFFYGLGLSLAEAVSLGTLLMATHRHRMESLNVSFSQRYWLTMFGFDLCLALIQIQGYMAIIFIMDNTQPTFIEFLTMFLMFLLYKLAYIPFVYLISIVSQSTLKASLFVGLFIISSAWVFGINLRTFLEWTFIGAGNVYRVFDWLLIMNPISALIDSISIMSQLARMDKLCKLVPAFIPTSPLVPFEGKNSPSLNDILLAKVDECLAKGKQGVSTSVFHSQKLGIIWDIYLILLFALIVWIFLFSSDHVLQIITRRFVTTSKSPNAKRQLVRSPTSDSQDNPLYKWDGERLRLVNEYLHWLADPKHAKLMSYNCILLRIWLKPIGSAEPVGKRLSQLLEPLDQLGLKQATNDYQIELKTTLQIFVRIGNERVNLRNKRAQLLELYMRLLAQKRPDNSMAKFVIVDYTQESLYKILLHGHYNIKSTQAII